MTTAIKPCVGTVVIVLLVSAALALPSAAQQQRPASAGDTLIAIDVLLQPDQTMVAKANAVNARLRDNYPDGYSLDATHAPHVTAGVATEAFVKQLKAEPFEAVTFKPSGVAIYQLGNFGTASKKLKEWE